MHVVRLIIEGRESVGRGARVLGISPRQMKRLRRKVKEHGVQGLLHGHRGKAASLLGIDPKTLYRKILGYQITTAELG